MIRNPSHCPAGSRFSLHQYPTSPAWLAPFSRSCGSAICCTAILLQHLLPAKCNRPFDRTPAAGLREDSRVRPWTSNGKIRSCLRTKAMRAVRNMVGRLAWQGARGLLWSAEKVHVEVLCARCHTFRAEIGDDPFLPGKGKPLPVRHRGMHRAYGLRQCLWVF